MMALKAIRAQTFQFCQSAHGMEAPMAPELYAYTSESAHAPYITPRKAFFQICKPWPEKPCLANEPMR